MTLPFSTELSRLAALRHYAVLDTPPEQALDELTALAASICEAPIALISFVDEHRLWFKSAFGLEAREAPREGSFCAQALLQSELFIVPDAKEDARFSENPLVAGEPGLRFYAGVPLFTPEGAMLGTLCVLDRRPRTLAPAQEQALRVLSRHGMAHLELRRRGRELQASEGKRRAILEAEPACVKLLGADATLYEHDITARKAAEDKFQRLNRLYAVSSSINEAIVRLDNTQELYEQACRIAVEQGGLVMAWVGLVESDRPVLRPVAIWGRDDGYLDSIQVMTAAEHRGGLGPAGQAFRTKAPACCNDIEGATETFGSRTEALQRGYRSCAAFPLKLEGQPVGVLVVYGDQAGYFDREELRLLNALAENISFAIESHRRERERKQAEEACRASEARYRTLFDSNVQGIMFWKAAGEITGANDAFLRIVGYNRADLEAGRLDWPKMSPPEYADLDRRGLAELAARGVCTPYEKELFRRDGSRVHVLIGSAAFKDTPGESVCFVLDRTERKKLEQQFLRAQRMESIGTLAGGIAHDLNNALGPIIMSIDLLALKFDDAGSQKLLAIISASAHRGADMVRQLLSFARGVEGRRMDVQLRHLIQDIEKIANDTFLKHVQVLTILSNRLWTVLGDPTQLHQVLLNLCVNARDAMPNGGTLTISAENVTFDESSAAVNVEASPGRYVLVEVEDSGTGIPPEAIERIFDPFFTTKELGQGTGLGLSTSLAIVKSHGGFIRVYSEVGTGTKFRVYLPARTGSAADAAEEIAAEMPRGHGELILVVDDEASVRQITQQTLEAFGYRVLVAGDGAEAIAMFARQPEEIAAVLTDMMMPVMDGPATIQVLRRMKPTLPIIAASGLAANEHVAQTANLGVKHFLPKPFTSETLLKVLKEILAGDEL